MLVPCAGGNKSAEIRQQNCHKSIKGNLIYTVAHKNEWLCATVFSIENKISPNANIYYVRVAL